MLAAEPPIRIPAGEVNPLITQAPVEVQRRYLQAQLLSEKGFAAIVLDAPGPDGFVQVDGSNGQPEMINPIPIARHGQVVDLAAVTERGGRSHIEMLAMNDVAKVKAYIGHRAMDNVALKFRRIHTADTMNLSPPGFTDGRDGYGLEP